MNFKFMITALAFLFVGVAVVVECVKITRLDVDTPIIAGEGGWLRCDWDERGDSIYTMKWYWGTQEFYRWTPKSENPILVFPLNAFKVDQTKSSKGHVFIKEVKLAAEGKFLLCEVTGEGPFFEMDYKEDKLSVVVIPTSKPLIEHPIGDSLRPGSVVSLNCTSSPSIPAANLVWEVNGKPVPDSYLQEFPLEKTEEGLFISKVGLYFKVEKKHFKNSTLNLRCVSRISTLYHQSDEHNHKLPRNRNSNQEEPLAQPAIGSNLLNSNGADAVSPHRALFSLGLAFILSQRILR